MDRFLLFSCQRIVKEEEQNGDRKEREPDNEHKGQALSPVFRPHRLVIVIADVLIAFPDRGNMVPEGPYTVGEDVKKAGGADQGQRPDAAQDDRRDETAVAAVAAQERQRKPRP